MSENLLLTDHGCDRATAYHMSNKIVRHRDGLFVTWLDDGYRVILARLDERSGAVLSTVALAQGTDNHCGAAMAITPDQVLHVLAGSHADGAFIHRWSATPSDPASWSLPLAVGSSATYPSLVVSPAGTLFLSYRHAAVNGPWLALFSRRPLGQGWSWRLPLTSAPAPLYTFPTNCLTVGPDGTLHLVIEFYKTFPQGRDYPRSPAVTHLESRDDGVTWCHDDGRKIPQVPVGLEDCTLVAHDAAGDLRPAEALPLADGRLLCGIWNARTNTAALHVRTALGAWQRVDLMRELAARAAGRVITSQLRLALDRDGSVLAVTTVSPTAEWSSPQNQLLLLWLEAATLRVLRHELVPQAVAGQSNWLPAIERGVGGQPPAQAPLILFTEGNRGEGCANDAVCRVRLLRLT